MERSLGHNARGKFAWPLIAILSLSWQGSTIAAELQEAQVTRIIKDVRLLPTEAVPRPAAINDTVRSDTAVRTGDESRTELTFTDKTLARLGANTIFTFNEGTRNLDLGTGVMLLHVPKGAGGAKISTAAVTAAITGTTVLIEVHSGKSPVADGRSTLGGDTTPMQLGLVTRKAKTADRKAGKGYVKFISLEGTARVFLNGHPEESVLIHPGQMLILAPGAPHLPDLVEVDLKKLVGTCLLITDFAPLASAPLIAAEIEKQEAESAEGVSAVVTDPTSNDVIDQAISGVGIAAAGGGGGPPLGPEFGPLTTITAPVPYVVNAGTQIMTAPTITTAGVTNQGRIYRGVMADGSASAYFFGSASAFDVDSGFDALGEGGGNRIPMAAFKFTSLEIAGDPVITVPPGGANNLGLVSEGGIISGAPGGALTFAGMNSVFLGAQNGSINLGATLSFSNLNSLFLYARGAGSNITLASPMTNMGGVEFDAEGSVQVNANETTGVFNSFTGDFLTGTGVVTAGVQVSIRAQNAVNFALGQFALGAGAQVFLNGTTFNMDASANPTLFTNAGGVSVIGTTINVTGATNMTFGNLTSADFEAGSGGIQASTMSFFHPANGLTMNSVGDINAKQILGGAFITSNGNITITGDLSALQTSATGNINVAGNLTNTQLTNATGPASAIDVGGTLTSHEVEVTGTVTATHASVQILNQNVTSSDTILSVGGGIAPYLAAGPGGLHQFTVSTVQSPNGIDFSGNNFSTPGSNAANLTINAQSQDISSGGINGANFDGGDAAPGGNPGNGGSLNIFTSGNINVTGANIDATTGIIDSAAPQPLGTGGSVVLNSSAGAIDVDSRIQVSSSDPAGASNRRSSAVGGNIALTTGATTGVAINVENTAQLLALLQNTPAAQGGLITISASSLTGNSQVNVGGTIEADLGGIDIRHASDSGTINLADATTMMADVIKVATLGDNSTLNIGAVNISATTLLRLYAGSISASNNSTINFMASCTLTGAEIDIAAHTVNIVGAATTVMTSSQAHIFATVANYQGFGGTGNSNTGTFTGAGAANPLPVNQAPLLGPPGGTIATALKNHAPPTGPGGR